MKHPQGILTTAMVATWVDEARKAGLPKRKVMQISSIVIDAVRSGTADQPLTHAKLLADMLADWANPNEGFTT